MRYTVIDTGGSRSFPEAHALVTQAARDGEVVVIIGAKAGVEFQKLAGREKKTAVLIELGAEFLAAHTGEGRVEECSNDLGFSRFLL